MRKSMNRTGAMGSKAQAMLGIGGSSSNLGVSSIVQTQRQGFMHKKPFTKAGITGNGNWQKRFFILKDSFLFWYKSKPSTGFDMTPSGCLPLGGCSVFPMGKDSDGGFVFEVSHADFSGAVLQLKCHDKGEVDDWIRVLQDCSKATWQNAMLGDALVQKLKHEGTKMEKSKDEALQEARRQAEEMDKERQAKLQLMEKQLMSQREHEDAILRQKELAARLETELSDKDAQLAQERKSQEEETKRIEVMQSKLNNAMKAIESLESSISKRKDQNTAQHELLLEYISTIKEFMAPRH